MENKKLFINGFWLKIIAMVAMTFDHVGFALGTFYYDQSDAINVLVSIFRGVGQIALPIFCFLIVEGVLNTKNIKKYFLRLGVLALLILIGIVLSENIPYIRDGGYSISSMGNIFIDLLLSALVVFLLRQKSLKLKALSILPILFGIASFVAILLEQQDPNLVIWWLPYFIRTQSGFYAIVLCLGFYSSYILKDIINLKPVIINSLAIIQITIHAGMFKLYIPTKLINADVISNLSARGSKKIPSVVMVLYFLAILPSKKSVIEAAAKTTNAATAVQR